MEGKARILSSLTIMYFVAPKVYNDSVRPEHHEGRKGRGDSGNHTLADDLGMKSEGQKDRSQRRQKGSSGEDRRVLISLILSLSLPARILASLTLAWSVSLYRPMTPGCMLYDCTTRTADMLSLADWLAVACSLSPSDVAPIWYFTRMACENDNRFEGISGDGQWGGILSMRGCVSGEIRPSWDLFTP